MPDSARSPANNAAKPPQNGALAYFRTRLDPLTSLVLTTPVFLIYHLGILFSDSRNGVDLFTELLVSLVEKNLFIYVLVTIGIGAGIVATGWFLRRRGSIPSIALGPVLFESTVWALLLWLSVGFATRKILGLSIEAPGLSDLQVGREAIGPLSAIVVSAGAGFHEELVFRAGLYAGLEKLLKSVGEVSAWASMLIACLVSALLFSAAHYVGDLGDHFELVSFTFRALMGVMLVFIYRLRGFAIAVYAHAIYDVLYFVVLA